MNRLNAVNKKIEETKAALEKLEAEANALRLQLVQKVALQKTGPDKFELSFNRRKITAIRKSGLGSIRYAVKEGGRTIRPSYYGNMSELRVAIATGKI